MDIDFRIIAILLEVSILAIIMYVLLKGMWLTCFDLGLGSKYKKFLVRFLIMIGFAAVVFFIAHLISFYPTIGVG